MEDSQNKKKSIKDENQELFIQTKFELERERGINYLGNQGAVLVLFDNTWRL